MLARALAALGPLALLGAATLAHGEIVDRSFVPVPEIIVDPNEGNTYGILAVWMFLDQNAEIRYLLAPDFRYNETKGFFPVLRLFGYPTDSKRYSIVAGKSTTKDEKYAADYYDRGLLDGRMFVRASAIFEQDSTYRFYGFSNHSNEDDETNYTGRELEGWVEPGYWIVPTVYASYRMRVRRFSVSAGQVSGLPFLCPFAGSDSSVICGPRTDVLDRGLQPGHYFSHKLEFGYDTRDSIDLPTEGAISRIYVELADDNFGSSTSYTKFGVDARGYIPLRGAKKNPIIALRAAADYVTGPRDTPFWERSSIGGRDSVRGYGGDRFIGFNRTLGSAEVRVNVYQRRLFGVNTELELAPFVDTGQVFKEVATNPVEDLHWAYGLGFRGIVRPQILVFVDVGNADEGFKVFTGIDYPF